MDSNMTPADFSALMGNNNGFGGNNAWWIILLFLIFMNGGNRGYGYANDATSQDILYSSKFQALDNKIDRLGNGIADLGYAMSNQINGVQANIGGAVNAEGRNLQAQISEATCKLENAIHAEGEATRGLIQTNEIQTLRDRLASVEMDNRMCGVVRYPNQFVYSAGNSPFCNCNCNCGNV